MSKKQEVDDEVDTFGRSTKGRPRVDHDTSRDAHVAHPQDRINRNNDSRRSHQDDYRHQRDDHRQHGGLASHANYRDRDRDSRDHGRDNRDSRERGRSRDDHARGSLDTNTAPPSLLPPTSRPVFISPSQMSHAPPLLSYPLFIQSQREDAPPHIFAKKYDDFQYQYVLDMAEKFFHANMKEEWFRDRYDPAYIVDNERNASEWAILESEVTRNAMIENPIQVLQAISLEPSSLASSSSSLLLLTASGDHSVSKHFPGHHNRAIFLSGIPDCCTKSQLKNAIMLAFSNPELNQYDHPEPSLSRNKPSSDSDVVAEVVVDAHGSVPLIMERIIISSPSWSQKHPSLHERQAWVIMQSSGQVAHAVKTLKNLIISIRGAEIIEEEVSDVIYEFPLHASIHIPRPGPSLPAYLSDSRRIASDTIKAIELCALLDDERHVPEATRYATIIDEDLNPEIAVALKIQPTYHLDCAIAYLRRVHCVSFYGAKKFRDEAHLLSYAPAVLHRHVPYTIAPEVNEAGIINDGKMIPSEAQADKDDDMMIKKAEDHVEVRNADSNEDHETGDDDEQDNDNRASKVVDDGDNTTAEMVPIASNSSSSTSSTHQRSVPLNDKRVDALLHDLRSLRMKRQSKGDDGSRGLTRDEVDAERIISLQNQAFDDAVRVKAIIEGEQSKARCCYASCKKLFKNLEFLTKHLRVKHESFIQDELVRIAEPYMKAKYDAEDLIFKPLPPIRIESMHGITTKSVRDIIDRVNMNRNNNRSSYGNRGGGGGGMRYAGGRDNRDHNSSRNYPPDNRSMSTGPHRRARDDDRRWSSGSTAINNINATSLKRANAGDDHVKSADIIPPPQQLDRPKSSYVDLDAPKDSVINTDSGVAILPPIKRRKLVATAPAAKK